MYFFVLLSTAQLPNGRPHHYLALLYALVMWGVSDMKKFVSLLHDQGLAATDMFPPLVSLSCEECDNYLPGSRS